MFEIVLKHLEGERPLQHMKFVILGYKKMYLDHENQIKVGRDKINQEIKEIKALGKQIEEQTQMEVAHMKKGFVEVINSCKQQLRRYMKPAVHEIQEEDEEN